MWNSRWTRGPAQPTAAGSLLLAEGAIDEPCELPEVASLAERRDSRADIDFEDARAPDRSLETAELSDNQGAQEKGARNENLSTLVVPPRTGKLATSLSPCQRPNCEQVSDVAEDDVSSALWEGSNVRPFVGPAGVAVQRRQRLEQIKQEVQSLRSRWRPAERRFSTGYRSLDRIVEGGLSLAAVHEWIAPSLGSAAWSLTLRVAARAPLAGRRIVLIDPLGDFYPPAAAQMGVPLDTLVIVHARLRIDVLWAAEQALRNRAVGALIVPIAALDSYESRRLQLAAEAGGGVGLLIRPEDAGGATFCGARLRVEPAPGPFGRRVRVTVLKLREGRPGGVAEFDLNARPQWADGAAEDAPAPFTSAIA